MRRYKNLPHAARLGMFMSLLGFPGWLLAVTTILLFEKIFGHPTELNVTRFIVVPLALTLLSLGCNFFQVHRYIRIPPRSLTVIFTALHGIWALYSGLQIHESYNGFLILLFFSFGLLFLKVSLGFVHTVLFSVANVVLALIFIKLLDIPWGTDEYIFLFFFAFYGLISAGLNEVARRNHYQLKREQKKTVHSFKQLDKVFYPHQLRMMEQGIELEKTMPCGPGKGCALFFDIIASSKVEHEKAQSMFRETFGRCSELMFGNYDAERMECNAFRINEMGDGFLCSIGYPFRAPGGRSNAEVALELAHRFIEIFEENVRTLDYTNPIYCSIGIAAGELESFYTNYRPIEYHMYGRAVILATRYEEVRKILCQEVEIKGSMLILQSQVFRSLSADMRQDFVEVDLGSQSFKVRDDPSATTLFYKVVNVQAQVPTKRAS